MPEQQLNLPYPFQRVWDATISVFQKAKWNVTRINKETGGFEVKITMDALTWTETFYVNLLKISDEMTKVSIGRVGLSQPFDWGIGRQYAESFLMKLRSEMDQLPPNP